MRFCGLGSRTNCGHSIWHAKREDRGECEREIGSGERGGGKEKQAELKL